MDDDEDEEAAHDPLLAARRAPLAGGGVGGGAFAWDDDDTAGFEVSGGVKRAAAAAEAEEKEEAGAGRRNKRAKRAEERQSLRAKEKAIEAHEREMAAGEGGVHTAEDYERLLLGEPNSSYLWVQFMTFQLGLAEVERAREVGERALKTIRLTDEEARTRRRPPSPLTPRAPPRRSPREPRPPPDPTPAGALQRVGRAAQPREGARRRGEPRGALPPRHRRLARAGGLAPA